MHNLNLDRELVPRGRVTVYILFVLLSIPCDTLPFTDPSRTSRRSLLVHQTSHLLLATFSFRRKKHVSLERIKPTQPAHPPTRTRGRRLLLCILVYTYLQPRSSLLQSGSSVPRALPMPTPLPHNSLSRNPRLAPQPLLSNPRISL